MGDWWLLSVLFFSMFGLTRQSSDIAPPPELTLSDIEVEVEELEDQRTNLYPAGNIVTCYDEDPARAFIQSVSPSSPCGQKCFSLEPCGGTGVNSSQEFCLFYLPGQGTLNFASVSKYTLTIGCTDDVEVTTTEPLTVTVVPNTPPVFDPPSPLTVTKTISGITTGAGDEIYDVNTQDIDDDPIYYTMATNPNTDFLEIGYADGKIRATQDLRFFCEGDTITASVTATDGHNPSIGPLDINLKLDPVNTAPVVNNLDTKIEIDENIGAGYTILDLDIDDSTLYPDININMRSTSSAGMEMYELDGDKLKTRINPHYERSDTRSVTLYFDLDDGYCKSPTYSLTVNIKDVNEPVAYDRKFLFIDVYEESINTPTGLNVIDEDINDKHTHTKIGGSGLFGIDPDSGDVYSLSDIDLESNGGGQKQTFYVPSQVTDQGGLTDTTDIRVRVWDANDNPPIFAANSYSVSAMTCTPPGTRIGQVAGSDADSDYQQNNRFYFGGSGGKFAVMSNGDIILTQECIEGEVLSGSASITDQGIYPGPLSGVPATITFQCGPCVTQPPVTNNPVTNAPTTQAPVVTTTQAPVTTAAATGGSGDDEFDSLLAWLIPAILGGIAWLGLTSFLIYRYCCPCKNPCAGKFKSSPRPVKVKPLPPKPKEPKLVEPKKVAKPQPPPPPPPPPPPKPVTPPPPPPPPKPEPEPYLFGFWKENYTDQDINAKQAPKVDKPVAIENMPKGEAIKEAPQNLKLGNPVTGYYGQHGPANTSNAALPSANPAPNGNAPAAANAAPKKNCVLQ